MRARHYLIFAICLMIFCGLAYAQQLPEEVIRYADWVFHNATVLTMDRDDANFSVAQAVAVRDGKIMAVGTNQRILAMAGPETTKVDLGGRTLLPGIIDTHSHTEDYAKRHFQNDFRAQVEALNLYTTGQIRMTEWNDRAAALEKVKAIVERAAPGQWVILSVGHEIEPGSIPQAKALRMDFDRIAPDNPLAFQQSTTHAVVNSKAMDMILKKYGDIPGIFKDEEGKPTGYLYGGARGALDEILPQPPPDLFVSAYRKELEEWAAMGVTTVSTRLKAEEMTVYTLLEHGEGMPIRIAYTHQIGWWNPMAGRDLRNVGSIQGHGTDRLWLTGIAPAPPDDAPDSEGGVCSRAPKISKIVTDVVAREMKIGDQTTVVTKDIYPEGLCRWLVPGGEVAREAVLEANKLGYRIAGVHTFGDRSIETMFDVFEEADKDRPIAGRRFAIDHTFMISPEVIERAKKWDIIWSVQPQMAESPRSDLTMMTYGETIATRWIQPVTSIMEAGMTITYGADTHGDRARPMFGMEFLVTRKNHRGMTYGPHERMSRADVLAMMTRWGAEYVEREDELGSIEPGKLADLIVLDKNPLDPAIADDQISDIQVLMTLVSGGIEFTEPGFADSLGLPQVGYRGSF